MIWVPIITVSKILTFGTPTVAYKLALPPQLSGIHDVFHVSMLRKYKTDASHLIDWQPLEIREDITYVEQPIRILDKKE